MLVSQPSLGDYAEMREGIEMRDIEQAAARAYRREFGEEPALVASAPGRVNLIGEHTDYNDGFVLPCAIDFRVAAAVGSGPGGLYSLDFAERRPMNGCADGSWADYPRGVAWALAEAGKDVPLFQAAFTGNVPQGSGLSSSAAVEAASILALNALAKLGLPRRDLALLCQRAENSFVGVNSGIMDQYAALLCQPNAALFIDCRSLEARSVPLDLAGAGLTLLVCDTGVHRELSSTAYNNRRAVCERAARTLGVPALRDATLDQLSRLHGEELRRARHVVTEDQRVEQAVAALECGDFTEFGQLMYASHASLRDDYEVSIGQLDCFVETAKQTGALGARLTGAGFGGCAIALVADTLADDLMTQVTERFNAKRYGPPRFYRVHPAAGAELAGEAQDASRHAGS
jgi:galactokinase